MIAKAHRSQHHIVLAVCDSDLLGKKFEENNIQLDLTADFYKGKEETDEKIIVLMKAASIMNFVGKKSVGLAVKEGVINKDTVRKIKGIPHAQCVRV